MTLRIYDAGKKYADRYTLYFPYPKWMQKLEKSFAYYFGFSFHNDGRKIYIRKFCSDIADKPFVYYNMGRKVQLSTLPKEVREWIEKLQKVWNVLCKESNQNNHKIWDAWNNDDLEGVFAE